MPTDFDWVDFAGGTANIVFDETQITTRGTSASRDLTMEKEGACRVGSGFAPLDNSFVYFVSQKNCSSDGYATGKANVVYLTQEGEIGVFVTGPGRGVRTERGVLHWSFSDAPVEYAITCGTSDDTVIPSSAEEVDWIKVDIKVRNQINLGYEIVYKKLVEKGNDLVRQICKTEPIPDFTNYSFFDAEGDIRLRLTRGNRQLKHLSSEFEAFDRIAADVEDVRATALKMFGRRVPDLLVRDHVAEILQDLEPKSMLRNLSDGFRINSVLTLVQLTQGISTRMPWTSSEPSFNGGQFQLTWNSLSKDPIEAFFRSHSEQGWIDVLNHVEQDFSKTRLKITCNISASEARNLPIDPWVTIEARMISYNSDQLVLECKAP
ncbi:hypothetical protein [Celeribacter litoreus]|uniref:hypothetical protein n=1 Tax=Celeribacter litoreus TaxID=2876714 RepID=UPI001CCD898B|nr:hypothetical protein [Celeribacter litoreus]